MGIWGLWTIFVTSLGSITISQYKVIFKKGVGGLEI